MNDLVAAMVRRIILFPVWLFGYFVGAFGDAVFAGMEAQARRRRNRGR